MKELTIPAYAKINLTLDVLGKRPDGYHDLSMVMQSVSLADQVIIRETGEEGFTLKTDLGFLPGADKNIAGVAARAFARYTGVDLSGLEIELQKQIPVCAGTAGGSSDGAAVLRGTEPVVFLWVIPPAFGGDRRGGGLRCALLRVGLHRAGRGPG